MRRRDEGAVAVIVAIVLLVFVAAVALAVDVGGLMLHRRGLVNSSDAAALSAARTCARGGFDDHGSTEDASDTAALANSLIAVGETTGTNILDMTTCGETSGHVTVGYTSQQSLFFAPVLGFNSESPVTTEATASWGLGANGAMPLVMTGSLVSTCPKPPPQGPNTPGQPQCGTWYDNDSLNNGNFGYIDLDPRGWNTPQGDCTAAGSPGASQLEDWVVGDEPTSVSLNWLNPTFACSVSGAKGGDKSSVWGAIDSMSGQVRDFPIAWDGCGTGPYVWCVPTGTAAPAQGVVYKSGNVYQYDIIGFAAMRIVEVRDWNGAGSTTTTTPGQPYTTFTWTPTDLTIDAGATPLPAGSVITWSGHKTNGQKPLVPPTDCNPTTVALGPGTYPWNTGPLSGCPGNNNRVDVSVSIVGPPVTTTTPGPCGPQPDDHSARCLITQYLGSTLTGDYPTDRLDNVRVIRLCDLAQGTCLDQ